MARLIGWKISDNGIVFASGVGQEGQPSVSLAHLLFTFQSQRRLTGNNHPSIAVVDLLERLLVRVPTHVHEEHTVFQNAGLHGEEQSRNRLKLCETLIAQ